MIKTVLIDLSGTLHIGNQPTHNAVKALAKLQTANLQIKFLTNTTQESRQILHKRLTDIGFTVNKSDIITSISATRAFLVRQQLAKPLLLVAPEALEDFDGFPMNCGDEADAVVIGLAPTEFNYDRLNLAFRCLHTNRARLVAIHAGRYYKREDGLALGPGCFVKGLEYAAQCEATVIGKPNRDFFLSAIENVLPHEVVMIGDDVIDDVEGAMKAGMEGYLVQTGKYQIGDENKLQRPPTAVVKNFEEAVNRILNLKT